MKVDNLNDMPRGWACTALENVATWASGGTPSRSVSAYFQGTIPWIKTGELGDKYIRDAEEKITEQAISASSAKIFPKGSVGIAMYGATIGKVSIWGIDASTNQACAVGFPVPDVLDKEFLYYFLFSQKRSFIKAGKGGAQPNISQGIIKEWPINLPPLNEQHRIVAKIEELFSELDKGIESLKTAREQLKVYRQALLKHAFEGKLTAQWREQNRDKLETAAALLTRIQTEREQRYQQQLQQWEQSKSPSIPLLQRGKTTSAASTSSTPPFEKGGQGGFKGGRGDLKPKAPKPLPPLTAEELAELPELPEGWGWVKYGDLCSIVRNGISAKPEGDSGTPIFRVSAVRPLFFDMADIRFIDNSNGEFDSYCLERGDLVFTRYNGSRHYVGVCAEYRSDEKRLFPDKLVQTRVFSKDTITSYLEKVLNSGASRRFVESKIRTTAGQSGVSGDDIKNIPVPLCATDEQIQIVAELESKLSETGQLDLTLTATLQQAEALRQSILKKAFSGQLVAQDDRDEPAAALLARIKAEQATAKDGLAVRKKSK